MDNFHGELKMNHEHKKPYDQRDPKPSADHRPGQQIPNQKEQRPGQNNGWQRNPQKD
jgi:hypothetical protein